MVQGLKLILQNKCITVKVTDTSPPAVSITVKYGWKKVRVFTKKRYLLLIKESTYND
jgi:hypothetical protein